jgi:hypothetical protein
VLFAPFSSVFRAAISGFIGCHPSDAELKISIAASMKYFEAVDRTERGEMSIQSRLSVSLGQGSPKH